MSKMSDSDLRRQVEDAIESFKNKLDDLNEEDEESEKD